MIIVDIRKNLNMTFGIFFKKISYYLFLKNMKKLKIIYLLN